jgi:hypothetical protein
VKHNTHLRINSLDKLNYRAASDSAPARVEGHAAVFNTLSEPLWDLGGAREMLMPGCFAAALARQDDTCLLVNHDESHLLARTTSGTLILKEDTRGLWFSASLPDTTSSRDLQESMKRGDISQCSFAFTIDDASMEMMGGEPVQTVRSVQLSDVSIVTYPAYRNTDASLRSHYQAEITKLRDLNKDATIAAGAGIGTETIKVGFSRRQRQIELLASEQ